MSERVVVAMSGGVDSSVAAALLVEQGYDVIGVMLRLWSETVAAPALLNAPDDGAQAPSDENAKAQRRNGKPHRIRDARTQLYMDASGERVSTNRCCSLESIHDARAVADRLGIPFYVINAEAPFKANVVDFFVQEYAAGRTPNPCLMCNRTIRFGFLLDFARGLDARYLATGHYARIRRDAAGGYQLWRGADRAKDQSYVLSVLGQDDLAAALFPVGEYTKPQVRALAAERGLPTASRVDSQDLCFVADGDYRRFVSERAPDAVRPGPILDRQGRRLGTHHGLPFYTIGQRSGLGVAASEALYVLALDFTTNAVIVGRAAELGGDWLRTARVNWIAGSAPTQPFEAEVQIRYHATPAAATVSPLPDGGAEARFRTPLRDITPGQAAVFYCGEICLGGGVIAEASNAGEAWKWNGV